MRTHFLIEDESKDITFVKSNEQLNILIGVYVNITRTPLTLDKAVSLYLIVF